MADPHIPGLHRAKLAALCTGGPWTTTDGDFDAVGLRRTYDAIARGYDEHGRLLLPWQGSDRRTDRALSMLRRAGLIEYAGKPKRWRVVGSTPTPPAAPGEE